MKKDNITVLWLDDQRDPNVYFKKKKTDSKAWVRNNDFYQENIFNNYKPNFIWVKNLPEFSGYIIKNGLPDLVSFDHDLSSKTVRCDHNGADCARWLVNYCKENGLQIPKCFAHTANNKQRPVLNNILGLNENKSKTMKINESQLKKIIKEVLINCNYIGEINDDDGLNVIYYDRTQHICIEEPYESDRLYISDVDGTLFTFKDGEWYEGDCEDGRKTTTNNWYFPKFDEEGAYAISEWISEHTYGSNLAEPSLYMN